jgi:hypothetical protein
MKPSKKSERTSAPAPVTEQTLCAHINEVRAELASESEARKRMGCVTGTETQNARRSPNEEARGERYEDQEHRKGINK